MKKNSEEGENKSYNYTRKVKKATKVLRDAVKGCQSKGAILVKKIFITTYAPIQKKITSWNPTLDKKGTIFL